MKRKNLFIILIGIALLSILLSKQVLEVVKIFNKNTEGIIVVIDAGHGGFDSGKVGINNALEKDINLSIALKLKELLEENDIKVIMTRKDQYGLYRKDSVNKKKEDMEKRVSIINSSDAIITVSIHQNSYSQEYCKGAQVFYHSKSEKGKILAEIIQNNLKETLNDGNKREVKPNSSYYLLRYSKCPLVIVECGFLSNRKEADLLCEDYYQDKVAWAIHLGIMEYINQFIS